MHMIQFIQINRKKIKGKREGGEKKEETMNGNRTKSSFFRLTFKESFRHGDG